MPRLIVGASIVIAALIGLSFLRSVTRPEAIAAPSPTAADPAAFLEQTAHPAPELALVDQDGAAFSVASLRGYPTLVFFGYTHCPDVCPETLGILGQVATAYGPGLRVVFVTVDPERDTVAFLKGYVRYLPPGFSALTGTAAEIRAAADGWGVRFARVEGSDTASYSMSHTAEVYLVDAEGMLRAHFPFGTDEPAMLATIRLVAGAGASSPIAATSPTPGPAQPTPTATAAPPSTTEAAPQAGLGVEVVTSTVWASGSSPVLLGLSGPNGRLADTSASVKVRLTTAAGVVVGDSVRAVAVRPPGVDVVTYVATLDVPNPGWWGLSVTATSGGVTRTGSGSLSALDPGETAPLGEPAPTERTPTLDDVGGAVLRVSTDPWPDLRLSRISTVDALAAGEPFVLVIDSARFKVTQACGKALELAKFMVDRWPTVPFIHLEPYQYDVVTDTATLVGSLAAPTLVPAARAWGLGGTLWGAGSMPWVYLVDGDGTVVAKYQGVVGTDDIDVIVSLLVARG